MEIRPERAQDRAAIRAVHAAAFAPSEIEAALVDRLRADGDLVPELSLVAARGDGDSQRRPGLAAARGDGDGQRRPGLAAAGGAAVVGHVAVSRAALDTGAEALALGPIGVLPEEQGAGIGGALMRAVLAAAADTPWPLIALLGHAEYYPRFGFEPAEPLGILSPYPVESKYWMAYRLPAYRPAVRGRFRYAPAFPEHA
jgi:putative acetyltransferase